MKVEMLIEFVLLFLIRLQDCRSPHVFFLVDVLSVIFNPNAFCFVFQTYVTQSGLEEALFATYTKILSPEGSISETAHIRQNAADPLEGCSALPTGAGGSGTRSATGLVNENFKIVSETPKMDPHEKGGPFKSTKYKSLPPASPRKTAKTTKGSTTPNTPAVKKRGGIPLPPPMPEGEVSALVRGTDRMVSLRSALRKAASELRNVPEAPNREPTEPLLNALQDSMTRMTKNFDEFDAILAARRAAVDEAIGRSSEEEDWM